MKEYCERYVECPHCGHLMNITLDASNGDQEFYDDCPACYRAVHLTMHIDQQHDRIDLAIDGDDEQLF